METQDRRGYLGVTGGSTQDRRGYLGGSDIAPIFGLSHWKTALDLYEEKTATEFIPSPIEPEREKRLRRGKILEPLVVRLIEDEESITVTARNTHYVDAEIPHFGCEVDFEFISDEGICNGDVKTISPFAAAEWGEEGTDEIPLAYALQFMWGLMIRPERPKTLVAAMIGADDLRKYWLRRDEDLIAMIRGKAIDFWDNHIVKRIPPPPQTANDTAKILRWSGGFTSAGSPEVWGALDLLAQAKADRKAAEVLKDEAELIIKRALAIEAQALGVTSMPPKHTILGRDGKPAATFNAQHRAGYTVGPADFYVLRAK